MIPFPKPCYLFALVAGHLQHIEDHFITRSARKVTLRIYVEPENIDQCQHAMDSLKLAMAWDEERFGLEYDLDLYQIVAVGDFNMGAMENKGLNIFNTKYVLAKPETATDADYQGILGVIGHEYFHNWTGNRVTCRDWFQLSLKEGLTVFRDQEFSSDLGSRGVKRIEDVRILRAAQFPQDAGPMAHPVRPDSYIEINNFYTVTVYNKGAEVIRMMQTLLGRDGFRRGMDLYFQRHDGQAVTCDDFVAAMADANGVDLTQFKRWYHQAGTPELTISDAYDVTTRAYTLTLRQSCPPTPGQPSKEPFHIPLAVGLLDAEGRDLPLQLKGESESQGTTRVLELREPEHTVIFTNIPSRPVPSLLRGFSAPVKLKSTESDADLRFRLAHDRDDFNRWDAGQTLAIRAILCPGRGAPAGQGMDAAGVVRRRVWPGAGVGCRSSFIGSSVDPARRRLPRRTDGRGGRGRHSRRAVLCPTDAGGTVARTIAHDLPNPECPGTRRLSHRRRRHRPAYAPERLPGLPDATRRARIAGAVSEAVSLGP